MLMVKKGNCDFGQCVTVIDMFSSFPSQSLEDIEIAMKTLKAGDYSENPVDRHYHALKCEMKPMEKSAADFKVITLLLCISKYFIKCAHDIF